MVKGLYTAYTGLVHQQKRLDVLTNNLANSATNAYKKEGTTSDTFGDTLAIKIKDTSEYGRPKILGEITPGTHIGETYRDYGQGPFRVTDNVYDVALDGDGFFAISFTNKQGQASVKYTRDGAFTVNVNGYLVTKDGDYVMNQAGANASNPGQGSFIRVNPNLETLIDERGGVYQNDVLVAQLGVVDFADYNYLEKYGENLFQTVDGAQLQGSTARVKQRTLEMSNVNVVSEMVEMITVARAFEANQKLVQTIDGTLDKAVNNLARI